MVTSILTIDFYLKMHEPVASMPTPPYSSGTVMPGKPISPTWGCVQYECHQTRSPASIDSCAYKHISSISSISSVFSFISIFFSSLVIHLSKQVDVEFLSTIVFQSCITIARDKRSNKNKITGKGEGKYLSVSIFNAPNFDSQN